MKILLEMRKLEERIAPGGCGGCGDEDHGEGHDDHGDCGSKDNEDHGDCGSKGSKDDDEGCH
jgi:hypothetical protein